MIYNLAMGSAIVLAILVIALACVNVQTIPVNLFFTSQTLPVAAIFVTSWLAGLVASIAIFQTKLKEKSSEKKLEEWQTQDKKLEKEIANDEVRLLKAKVDTLETALNKALEKQRSK